MRFSARLARTVAPPGTVGGIVALTLVMIAGRAGEASAFPFLDASSQDQVPQGTELTGPEAQDLAHQLQLVNGLTAPLGGGWTILPRIDVQEEITDNVLQVNSPRRADLVTFVAPGIGIAGDMPRLQITFDYAPTLALYVNQSDLNALTQQLNGIASVTLVPDFAFVDVRAISGVLSQYGAVGGFGTLGNSATAMASTGVPVLSGNTTGLNRNNEVQTSSFSISPYILDQIRDLGNVKVGYSLGLTYSDTLQGFVSSPFPTGGSNGQSLLSNEGYGHFDTGDNLGRFQDSVDVDLLSDRTTTQAGFIDLTGVPSPQTTSAMSSRAIVSDRITFVINRELSVFASGGHEDITYSGADITDSGFALRSIHDLTWSFGGTWMPNPDSSLSISYGHSNGFNSLTVNGYYAVTARTSVTVSYASTLGTQLENVQNQLNLAAAGPNGGLVNATTGGPLFTSTNGLALANGVFKTTTLSLSGTTSYDRDIINFGLYMSKQTSEGGGLNSTTTTATASWVHAMRPDMTVSAAATYSWQNQGTGYASNPGNSQFAVLSLAYAYQISATTTASIRYSFLDRQSAVAAFSLYQNLLFLGISKTF